MDFRENGNKRKPLALFSQASLTDIILLLLIFFLLTSSFVTNHGIRVEIPRAEAGTTTEAQHISVAITADGTFFVNGEETARANLPTAIRQEYQSNPQASLVLRADREAKVDDAVRVMNIGQALNMNVMMATERNPR